MMISTCCLSLMFLQMKRWELVSAMFVFEGMACLWIMFDDLPGCQFWHDSQHQPTWPLTCNRHSPPIASWLPGQLPYHQWLMRKHPRQNWGRCLSLGIVQGGRGVVKTCSQHLPTHPKDTRQSSCPWWLIATGSSMLSIVKLIRNPSWQNAWLTSMYVWAWFI